jgi:hypothetical protein
MPTTPQIQVPPGEKTKATYKDVRPYIQDEEARQTVSEYHGTPLGYTRLGTLPHAIKSRVLPKPPGMAIEGTIRGLTGGNPADALSQGVRGFGQEGQMAKELADAEQGALSPRGLSGAIALAGDIAYAKDNYLNPERMLAREAVDSVARSRRRKAYAEGDLPAHRYPIQMFKDNFFGRKSIRETEDGGYEGSVKPLD